MSSCVHGLPSSQVVPLSELCRHVGAPVGPVPHISSVQSLPSSSQTDPGPRGVCAHWMPELPCMQTSKVHELPSLAQALPCGMGSCWQLRGPPPGGVPHRSKVQGLPSSVQGLKNCTGG